MKQCLKITFSLALPKKFLHNVIQKHAKDLLLEGTVQAPDEKNVRIIICGDKEAIDNFVDLVHQEILKKSAENIEIEPFIKDKDFRGVFRVIA